MTQHPNSRTDTGSDRPDIRMKIAVVGLGYVGMSNAVLLAQHHQVVAVDLMQQRVDLVNARRSPIEDPELED